MLRVMECDNARAAWLHTVRGTMDDRKPAARAAVAEDVDWERAVDKVLAQTQGIVPDLAILFANAAYAEHFPQLVRRAWNETGASTLIGCSGQGIISSGREVEDGPAVALLTMALPGAVLRPVRLTQEMVETCTKPDDWRAPLTPPPDEGK